MGFRSGALAIAVTVTSSLSAINPKDYGAKLDGITDDAAAFQAAINVQQTLGGYIAIPAGTVLVLEQLVPALAVAPPYGDSPRPLIIRGAGMDNTIIKAGSQFLSGGIFAPGGGGSHPHVAQLDIADLTLDGNYSGVAGGALAQPGANGGALVSLPWPGTQDTATAYNGRYHRFTRVKFYRPTAYCFQPTNGVHLIDCIFDSTGQPDIAPGGLHYDNLGSGQGDAIVIGCTWLNSSGNYADFVATAGMIRLVMSDCESYSHQIGGVIACGLGSIITNNRLANLIAGSGIGYDVGTAAGLKGANIVTGNVLTNIDVNAGGLSAAFGDLVYANVSHDGSGHVDFYQAINAADGLLLPANTHGLPGPGFHGDGTNIYEEGTAGATLYMRPEGPNNQGAIALSKVGGLQLFDSGGAAARSAIFSCTGAPSNAIGNNGDFMLRQDGGAGTRLYFKTGGAWTGIA